MLVSGLHVPRKMALSQIRAVATMNFENSRGEFCNRETLNGKPILVRFVISNMTATACHFEQAFSDDGGKTWEVNWIATDTRDAV